MRQEKINYIQAVVTEIRKYFQLKDFLSREDLTNLVEKLEGSLEFQFDLDVDAKIERIDKNFKITIKPSNLALRDNFSIAHELGHLFLHMGYLIDNNMWMNSKLRYDRFGYSQEEFEANEFAGNLLMQEHLFIKEFRNNYDSKQQVVNLKKMSKIFNVSPKAIEVRAKNIGLIKQC